MAATDHSGKTLPAIFPSLYLRVMADVLGQNGADAVLRRSGLEVWSSNPPIAGTGSGVDFAQISAMLAALEETIGRRGAAGMERRMGMAVFEEVLRPHGPIAAMQDPAFQALPADKKLRAGILAITRILGQLSDWQPVSEEIPGGVLVRTVDCPDCWGRSSHSPVCNPTMGLLMAGAYWSVPESAVVTDEAACRALDATACEVTLRFEDEG
ncbi:MAG TPA: hypothetical protein VLL77_09445 [Anaerolineales bacterium]|nr:hypothetical protein [Anaerolineales bacterium]